MKLQQLGPTDSRPDIQVHLPDFDGPFDLLIHLVERDKLDVYSISVAEITSSYLESIEEMQFDAEAASDFIFMAAYLLELKSRSLLPRIEPSDIIEEPDPRQELIRRLVEYKHFKEMAAQLEAMHSDGQRVYTRPTSLPDHGQAIRPLANMSLDNLFSAYARALDKARVEVRHLTSQGISVRTCMEVVRQRVTNGPVYFAQLAGGLKLPEVVATFLAVLELMRLREVVAQQKSVFAPIIIETVGSDGDA